MTSVAPSPLDTNLLRAPVDEQELTRQALAATPLERPAEGAVPDLLVRGGGAPLLPEAYMPAPMGGPRPGWLKVLALLVIAALVTITAAGFCITYGALSFA